jgi:hypothetical protein
LESFHWLKQCQWELRKLPFDLSYLSSAGLIRDVPGVQSLSYEFCIPATAEALAEVQAIDPTLHHYLHSAGRMGCTGEQCLCIGSTHQPNWRQVLLAIARLDSVERIDEFFGE